jgi:hypothetical protein
MKPLQHAKISAKKHGGKWEDYIDIHEFFDQTKAQIPDMRHRAILHNSMGIFICAQVFGEVRTNSAGREYSVRDIGEDHVLEDLGTIPTLVEVINCIDTKHLKWLGGLPKNKRTLVTKIPKGKKAEEPAKPTVNCDECGKEALLETPEMLRAHEETCPVLKRAVESMKGVEIPGLDYRPAPVSPSRDMVIDGGGAFYRRPGRSRLID